MLPAMVLLVSLSLVSWLLSCCLPKLCSRRAVRVYLYDHTCFDYLIGSLWKFPCDINSGFSIYISRNSCLRKQNFGKYRLRKFGFCKIQAPGAWILQNPSSRGLGFRGLGFSKIRAPGGLNFRKYEAPESMFFPSMYANCTISVH